MSLLRGATKSRQTTRTTQTETYEGWSNRETWLVDLFLDCDDYGTYRKIKKQLRKMHDVKQKADVLSLYMRHQLDRTELDDHLMTDMLMAAFGHVNWQEIIEKRYS